MNGYANQIEALISSSDNHSLVDALEDLELTVCTHQDQLTHSPSSSVGLFPAEEQESSCLLCMLWAEFIRDAAGL